MGIGIRFGPYEYRIQSPINDIAIAVRTLYGDREFRTAVECPDFRVRVDPGWHKASRCVYASVNGQIWKRWPKRLTVGALEWVCNWCFFRGTAGKFALHAASAEVPSGKGAIVFPGLSGAGKSTLAATLMLSGWRLLSDEVALFDLQDHSLTGLGRSTVLKGESLKLIRDFFPEKAIFGPVGRMLEPPGPVAHLRPTTETTEISGQTFLPLAFCFPERQLNTSPRLEPFEAGLCFSTLSQLGLNYRFLGPDGFETLLTLTKACPAFRLVYSDATDAERFLRELDSEGDLQNKLSESLSTTLQQSRLSLDIDPKSNKQPPTQAKRPAPQTQQTPSSSSTHIERDDTGWVSVTGQGKAASASLDSGRHHLFAILRGEFDWTALTLAEWDTLLLVANHFELASQLATSCYSRHDAMDIPAPARVALEHAQQAVTFNHKLHNFELQCLQRIAKASHTQPVLLKGAAYLACRHPWAQGRKTNDIDLLLEPNALNAFERFLQMEGYEPDSELTASDRRYYRKWLHELPPYKHSYRKIEVDVHFRLLPVSDPRSFPTDKWIERSHRVADDSPFRVLDRVDQVLHAIVNLGHTGEFRRAVRDTWDISNLLNPENCGPDNSPAATASVVFDWAELQHRTKQLRLQKTVSKILLLGEELVGLSLPEHFIEDLTGKSNARIRSSTVYRTMKTASLPDGPTLRSRKRYHALWAMEHFPLPKLSTWLDPLTWTKRFHFMTDE